LSPRFQDREQDSSGRPGIDRALQNDKLPWPQAGADGPGRRRDEAQVGVTRRRQGGRDADQDRVRLTEAVEIVRRVEVVPCPADRFAGDVADEALAALEFRDFYWISVEPQDEDLFAGKGQRQRETHIAQANDSDANAFRLDSRALRLEQLTI
jgi:hypothetical protein